MSAVFAQDVQSLTWRSCDEAVIGGTSKTNSPLKHLANSKLCVCVYTAKAL